jgi:uncharacterized protein with HEPN domain
MRRDQQRLWDILEALDSIPRIIGDHTEVSFLADETLCFAVSQRLTVVGEAAARLTPDLRERHPAVPWAEVVALRNVLVHEYFGVFWPMVWHTATVEAPQLRNQIASLFTAEFEE